MANRRVVCKVYTEKQSVSDIAFQIVILYLRKNKHKGLDDNDS